MLDFFIIFMFVISLIGMIIYNIWVSKTHRLNQKWESFEKLLYDQIQLLSEGEREAYNHLVGKNRIARLQHDLLFEDKKTQKAAAMEMEKTLFILSSLTASKKPDVLKSNISQHYTNDLSKRTIKAYDQYTDHLQWYQENCLVRYLRPFHKIISFFKKEK